MPALNLSIEHGQPYDAARANFETSIVSAGDRFSRWIKAVEWSDDRTAARLTGPGFEVRLKVDPTHVHAAGHIPIFVKLIEAPLRKFLAETLQHPAPLPKG